jgi:hypothetical protein
MIMSRPSGLEHRLPTHPLLLRCIVDCFGRNLTGAALRRDHLTRLPTYGLKYFDKPTPIPDHRVRQNSDQGAVCGRLPARLIRSVS